MRVLSVLLSLCALAAGGHLAKAERSPSPEPSQLEELATADDTKGWEGVGRLDFGGGAFCTGALIGPDLVLTAAHCLYDKHTGQPVPHSGMTFLAGFRNGRAEAYRGIRRSLAHPAYQFDGDDDGEATQVADDIALVQLDRPIRLNRIAPFAVGGTLRSGEAVGLVSYAEDREEAPSLQEVCHVLETGRGMAMLSCAVDFGASGAPIFRLTDEGPVIVSVVSAMAKTEERTVALASTFGLRYLQLKAAWETAPTGTTGGARRLPASGGALSARTGGAAGSSGAKFIKP